MKVNIALIYLTLSTVCYSQLLLAQSPQGFNYQGVARDNNGSILKSQTIGFRVSILADSTNGTVVYSETHTIVSNTNGVFELVVGQGTVVSGNFSAIDWGSAGHFLKTEMDASGGTSYIFYGTTQLLAVPYAMYAKNAGNVAYSDTSATNELQILSLTNDTLYLSNGGFIVLLFNYNDTSATNELQIISISNDTLYLTNGGYVVLPGLIFKDKDFEIINETAFADAPTTVCTAALAGSGAGNVDNGTHDYKITYITTSGETEPGPASNSVTVTINATDGKILLTNIPVSSDSGVVARKIYRRLYAAGTDYFLVDTIQDNTTTIYIDSIGFASLGDTVPDSNSTKVMFKFDASQLTETRTYTMPNENGELALNNEITNALGGNFLNDAQLLFNADYSGFDSRLFNSGSPNLDNIFYSTFTTNDVDINYGFIYDFTNDLYGTPDLSVLTEYIIIEADDAIVSWSSNNCLLLKVANGKWILYGTSGSNAVKRAQIIKSLFYGTTGSNSLILDFTSVTALKTTITRDEGKRGHYAYTTTTGTNTANYTGTFADTSTNTDCSIWGRGFYATPFNTLGTDKEADELDNPVDVDLYIYDGGAWTAAQLEFPDGTQIGGTAGYGGANAVETLILAKGGITWVATGSATNESNIDFNVDHSIPDFTSAGSLADEGLGSSTLIFKDTASVTVTNAIPVINSIIDATSSEQISISADGGTNWTNVNNGEGASPTAGTALWRRIVITRTDLSKIDKVTEQAVKYNFY